MRATVSMWLGTVLTSVLVWQPASAADPAVSVTIRDSQLDTLDAWLTAQGDSFAGFTVDPQRRRVVVRQVSAAKGSRLQSFVASLPKASASPDDSSWTLVTKTERRSHRQLSALHKRILNDEPFASLLRPVLAKFHIDIERNVVAVGVTAISDELFDEAKQRFGDGVELYVTERIRPFSRTNWVATGFLAAGTRLTIPASSGNAPCTSGFSVRPTDSSSVRGFVTAGHCLFPTQFLASITDASGNYVAPSFVWHWGDFWTSGSSSPWTMGADAGLIVDRLPGQTFVAHPSIYTTNTFRRWVVGTRTPRDGDAVCFGGALTGENCTARITDTGISAVFASKTDFPQFTLITDLFEAESTNASNIAQPGDSGGPVYVRTSIGAHTVVRAVGGIIGGPADAPTPVAYFQSINKIVPMGWQVWAANCRTIFGALSCSTN